MRSSPSASGRQSRQGMPSPNRDKVAHIRALKFVTAGPFGLLLLVCRAKEAIPLRVKYWEIIADNLSKAGWSWGWVSAVATTRPVRANHLFSILVRSDCHVSCVSIPGQRYISDGVT